MSTAGELAIRAHRGPVHSAVRVLVLVGGLALAGLICELAGVDLSGWLGRLFDKVAEVSPGWVVLGLAIQTVQTFLISLAWLAILRSAYGQHSIGLMPVFAAYAVSVALNCLLPANLGTFVMLTMFLALVQGATLAGLFSAFLVQKLPYAVIGVSLYLYLFISVAGSFSIKLKRIADHPWMATLIVIGGIVLIALVGRIFWPRLESLWQQAKRGATILSSPRAYLLRVVVPELAGFACKLGVVAVFLAAYGIPVSFHGVMFVGASNSLANFASVTPGGVGVNQTLNVAALHGDASAKNAAAYSIGHQLLTSAWNVVVAVALVAFVFGWSGGRRLLIDSYTEAREKVAEHRESPPPEAQSP